MSDDGISDEDRALEQKLREKWQRRPHQGKTSEKPSLAAPVEFHFYTRQLPTERGEPDTYWRIDKIEGSSSSIHREFNSKTLALIEVERLRKAGFVVHAIQTPQDVTLEALEKREREFRQILDQSKNTTDIIEMIIAQYRREREGK